MEKTVRIKDRMSGAISEKSARWYEALKKSSKNKLPDGTSRYVLAEGAEEPEQKLAGNVPEKKNPPQGKPAQNAAESKKILTETQELSDETVETFLKASGQISSVEKLVKALGEKRAAEWKDRIDTRIAEIQAENKPAEPKKEPKTGGKK